MSSSEEPPFVTSPFILAIPLRAGVGIGAPNAAEGGEERDVSSLL